MYEDSICSNISGCPTGFYMSVDGEKCIQCPPGILVFQICLCAVCLTLDNTVCLTLDEKVHTMTWRQRRKHLAKRACWMPFFRMEKEMHVFSPAKEGPFWTLTGGSTHTIASSVLQVKAFASISYLIFMAKVTSLLMTGTGNCELCPENTYAARSGLLECLPCPRGTFSLRGSSACSAQTCLATIKT